MDEECICLNCLYGAQPYGYFPIVCVQGKRIKEMYHEVFKCRHFERCQDPPETLKMTPWEISINKEI